MSQRYREDAHEYHEQSQVSTGGQSPGFRRGPSTGTGLEAEGEAS